MNGRIINHYVTLVAVLVAAIFVNLVSVQLSKHIQMRYDMTPNRIFELSDNTTKYLDLLDESIVFYYLTESGRESPYVTEVLGRYEKATDKIRVKTIDIIKNPTQVVRFQTETEDITRGCIVVESSKRFMVVDSGSALAVGKDEKGNLTRELGFSLEQKLTNAIDFVCRDKNITVKYTNNHGEADFKRPAHKLKNENIAVEQIDLSEEVLTTENTNLLVLFGLREDISQKEYENIKNYLDGGGRVFIAVNPAVECPREYAIINDYQITLNDDAAYEGEASQVIENNRLYLFVNPKQHKITDSIKNSGKLLFPATRTLSVGQNEFYKTRYLAITNESVLSKELTNDGLGKTLSSGELGVAAISEHLANGSMLFVAGTTQFLSSVDKTLSNILDSISYINSDFFIHTVKYMAGGDGMLISVSPKNIMIRSTNLTLYQKVVLIVIFGFVLPIGVLISGVMVWFRRKNL